MAGYMIAAALIWVLGYGFYLRGVNKDRSQITVVFWIGMAVTLLGLGLLLASMHFDDKSNITLYLVGMLSWLAIAGLNFVASVFSYSKTEDN